MTAAVDVSALQDRLDVADAIYRYASTIDRRDIDGLRKVLADDIVAQYGNAEPMSGGDTVAAWIDAATADAIWQHHLLSVYHTDIDGDRAKALVYHTSYQCFTTDPGSIRVLVARYHDELIRTATGWRISKLLFEILWSESRTDPGDLPGGRGPLEVPG